MMLFRINFDMFKKAMTFNEGPVFLVDFPDRMDLYARIAGFSVVFTRQKLGDEEEAIFFESHLNKLQVIPASVERDELSLSLKITPEIESGGGE